MLLRERVSNRLLGKTYSNHVGGKPMKLLTLARDLGRRKARERDLLFVAEGIRAVEELVRSPRELGEKCVPARGFGELGGVEGAADP